MDSTVDKTANQTVKPPISGKSFAQILSGEVSGDSFQKVVMGSSVHVKISRAAYESGVVACKTHLHGRLTLHKGDAPLTMQALKAKLSNQWPQLQNWSLIPLGKGFFEFNFNSIEDMRIIRALGIVNLKPGLMRFYCWSKDFAPQAQSQTHAQVWVRFLNLPQEYWEKQTLFEIASGLGTPLSINESTQHRRFGIFARVLIDVDLSENLFEYVVVEREYHALSIPVQYEKHPLFCAHCKMIGHSFQTCSKLGAYNTAHKKIHTGHKAVNASGHKAGKSAQIIEHNEENEVEVHKVPAIEVEDGEIVKSNIVDALTFVGNHELGHVQKPRENLKLHNNFELLELDIEQGIGEATTNDKKSTPTILDLQIDKNSSVDDISLGKKHLNHNTTFEGPSKLVKRTSKLVELSSGTSPVSFGDVMDPIFYETIILQPIISPIITIDEILGQDRRKVQITDGPKNKSAACLKDGKVLSKLWGYEDTDASDSTVNPETGTEVNKAEFPDVASRKSPNLEGTSSVTTRSDDDKETKSFTPFVSNKQKKKNKLQSPRGSENNCIQTRAKSGISKAYKS